ncbi:hypothetical protein CAEBREN_08364 [Caenorhabditis brenneri]|uniref:F-box domain-containing protein n=1 Tax=Caenorhabditis brenneri TaxID=135651 RepID=G0NMQ3_CAEBE|nr:hypothetical protein CAEBREN_08364 [Caenorhabditis brenneri]
MKLLNFPLLVLEQILISMNYPQLFFLSFCSNKTKRLISLFKYNLIEFAFCFGQYALRVFFTDKNKKHCLVCKIFSFRAGAVSRNLTIQYPSRPFTEFTDHYRGRFAVFCTPNIRDARVFIDRWLRKECCDNLNNAIFFNTTGRPFDDTLLVNFGQKRIDRTTMPTVPEKYPFDKDDLYYIGGGSDKLITDGSYYAERFDGKFATIAYWDTYVVFSVWDKRPW